MVLRQQEWRSEGALGKHCSVSKDRTWHLMGHGETVNRRGTASPMVSVQKHMREVGCVCVFRV